MSEIKAKNLFSLSYENAISKISASVPMIPVRDLAQSYTKDRSLNLNTHAYLPSFAATASSNPSKLIERFLIDFSPVSNVFTTSFSSS